MKFSIITAFPNAFSFLNESIPKRSQEKELVNIEIVDLRKFSDSKWGKIDDKPYGGGAGMLLMVEPIYKAIKYIKSKNKADSIEVWLMGAGGITWNQSLAEKYSSESGNLTHKIIIAGHYEGVDYRVVEHLVDKEFSVGNYVLSGGELSAMVVMDSIIRLIPGVISKEESHKNETKFLNDYKIKEHPHYTRPESFETEEGGQWKVPDILLSGNHGEINKWRTNNSSKVNI